MKATELMIGDWILLGVEPIKVTYDLFLPGHLTDPYRPIPLTPEILEKNGFVYEYRPEPYSSIYEKDNVMLTKNVCDAFPRLRIGRKWIILQYVHELQHTLRLCGLTELANNLKIE